MKILIVNSFYYPNIVGGAEQIVKAIAEKLSINNEVAIFCTDDVNNLKKEELNNVLIYKSSSGIFNAKVRITKKGSKITKIINKLIEFRNYTIMKDFKQVVNEFNPDIIYTNNLYGISPLIWKYCHKKNIKIVHTIHDYWMYSYLGEYKNGNYLIDKIYRKYFKNCSKYVDYVTAPSKFTLDCFIKNNYFKKAKYEVIFNGIEIENDKLIKIIQNKNKNNNIKFIYVGGIEEKKGIKNLIEAFNNLKNDYVTLDIFGTGSLSKYVKEETKKNKKIIYHGYVPKDEVDKYRRKCDVAIVPSIWDEPFGLVVIEANMCGLPVIGSNKGGIKEILDNIETGITFKYDDVNDLKEKMNYMCNRKNITKYYNNILKNIEEYSIDKQIEKLMIIFNDKNLK